MSRIHEALKKAELERAGVSPGSVERGTDAPVQNGSAVSAAIMEPAVRDDEVLRFNDIVERCKHVKWRPDPQTSVFGESEISVDGAEQFRSLRSRLYQLRGAATSRTLLVTSALSGEGKTFVVNNLGQAMVRQHERRALLIDADLRRSRLHAPLNAPSTPGLTDYLRGDVDLLSVIQYGHIGNLCFIPGGSVAENPSELLANGRMKILLDRVGAAFDWVLIDSPPCLPVADASILAGLCDGILFVVKANSTPAAVVEKAARELRGRNIVGVVMNAVDGNALGYSSYYGSGYVDNGRLAASTK